MQPLQSQFAATLSITGLSSYCHNSSKYLIFTAVTSGRGRTVPWTFKKCTWFLVSTGLYLRYNQHSSTINLLQYEKCAHRAPMLHAEASTSNAAWTSFYVHRAIIPMQMKGTFNKKFSVHSTERAELLHWS